MFPFSVHLKFGLFELSDAHLATEPIDIRPEKFVNDIEAFLANHHDFSVNSISLRFLKYFSSNSEPTNRRSVFLHHDGSRSSTKKSVDD